MKNIFFCLLLISTLSSSGQNMDIFFKHKIDSIYSLPVFQQLDSLSIKGYTLSKKFLRRDQEILNFIEDLIEAKNVDSLIKANHKKLKLDFRQKDSIQNEIYNNWFFISKKGNLLGSFSYIVDSNGNSKFIEIHLFFKYRDMKFRNIHFIPYRYFTFLSLGNNLLRLLSYNAFKHHIMLKPKPYKY